MMVGEARNVMVKPISQVPIEAVFETEKRAKTNVEKMKQSLIKMVSEDEDEKHLKRMLIIYTISREEA